MARRWTIQEENIKRVELEKLYIRENKTIREIAAQFSLAQSTVYGRLVRLGLPPLRTQKRQYCNRNTRIKIPTTCSASLAEFVGILLGDGNLTPTQVTVTLGKKDQYAPYVVWLGRKVFGIMPRIMKRQRGETVIYFGSTEVVRWLLNMGLQFNKVKTQVNVPAWIFEDKDFMRATLRGLIDTDGSVYRLRYGIQMSFCNRSRPLLLSVQRIFQNLGFRPSKVGEKNVYLTRKHDLVTFFREIGFQNKKHHERFVKFAQESGWVV